MSQLDGFSLLPQMSQCHGQFVDPAGKLDLATVMQYDGVLLEKIEYGMSCGRVGEGLVTR
jgi:hypothetical protein